MAAVAPPYIELHCRSAYSLGGGSLPEELVAQAARLGYPALGLADVGVVGGAIEHHLAAREHGVAPIHGAELPLENGRRLTLLVESGEGWGNLCQLLTAAARNGGVAIEQVCAQAEGLVCLSGPYNHALLDPAKLALLREAFGRERLFLELQRPYVRGERSRNNRLLALARRLGVGVVATGGITAHTPIRSLLGDALIAARNGLTLEASEGLRPPNHTNVLASPQAMAARFSLWPGVAQATVELAQRLCGFDLLGTLSYRYPSPAERQAARRLRAVCERSFAERYPPGNPHRRAARSRLEEELALIERLCLSGFFLLHHELLELAKEVAAEVRGGRQAAGLLAPGRGRGSSVSSIVCYLTGLSHIDPIANGLLLSRFLHEGLSQLPDIDIDFPRDIRDRLIARIHETYGRDHTALVGAYATYKTRSALKDIGKALGLPTGLLERLAKGVEGGEGGRGLAAEVERLAGRGSVRLRWLARLVEEAYGLPRHLTQHPGGMVISHRRLDRLCQLVPAAMAGRQLLVWDKDSCAEAGFLKIDLLGLGMLSAVEGCVELIHRRHGKVVDLSRIPFDDPAVFKEIAAANTTGVFQIESRAQMASLRRTRPSSLAELTIQVAIVRPGPIVGGAVNPYLARLARKRNDPTFRVPYPHPSLEPVLAETLGVIIFQDQVLEVARAFAGFTAAEAEGLRRAMSRKRSREAILRYRRRFIEGAKERWGEGVEPVAEQVFGMIEGFSGFGFPKSHAAAFGLLAYQTAWLRRYYPAEFLCALLNAQPLGFYTPDALIQEARRRGIEVVRADVNKSELQCTVEGEGRVRLGLRQVKGVVEREVAELLAERRRGGPYRSLAELCGRVAVSTQTLRQLAKAGALPPSFAGSRRQALYQASLAGRRRSSQPTLPLPLPKPPPLPPQTAWEGVVADYATLATSPDRHPLALLRPSLRRKGVVASGELPAGGRARVGGLVIARQRPQSAKGVVFLLLEDEQGTVNVIIYPSLYRRNRLLVRTAPLLLVEGQVERPSAGEVNLIARRLRPLEVGELAGHLPEGIYFGEGRR